MMSAGISLTYLSSLVSCFKVYTIAWLTDKTITSDGDGLNDKHANTL